MSGPTPSSLRAALLLALRVARQGDQHQPPVAAPPRLRPYLGFAKVPAAALEACRRVVDEEEPFRRRVAAAATVDEVGALGFLWLTRPDNWEATAAELQAAHERERSLSDAARRQDELARREALARRAAHEAEQARRELQTALDRAHDETEDARRQHREATARLHEARAETTRLELDRQDLLRRLKAAEALVAARSADNRRLRAERDDARRRLDERESALDHHDGATGGRNDRAATDRHGGATGGRAGGAGGVAPAVGPDDAGDAVAGDRPGPGTPDAGRPGAPGPAGDAGDAGDAGTRRDADVRRAVDEASRAALLLADALARAAAALAPDPTGDAGTPGPTPAAHAAPVAHAAPAGTPVGHRRPDPVGPNNRPRRRAVRLPVGMYEESPDAAQWLLRRPGVLVLVDGYNVAMLGWPDLELARRRDRLVDSLVALQARTGSRLEIVFDGDDEVVAPARTVPERVRVEFTPTEVEADDRLLERIGQVPVDRPVVVVSSDRRVRDGARRLGANTLGAAQLLAVLS